MEQVDILDLAATVDILDILVPAYQAIPDLAGQQVCPAILGIAAQADIRDLVAFLVIRDTPVLAYRVTADLAERMG